MRLSASFGIASNRNSDVAFALGTGAGFDAGTDGPSGFLPAWASATYKPGCN